MVDGVNIGECAVNDRHRMKQDESVRMKAGESGDEVLGTSGML